MIRQLGLDALPGGVIDDRALQPFVQRVLVSNFADVDRIAQDVVECTA